LDYWIIGKTKGFAPNALCVITLIS